MSRGTSSSVEGLCGMATGESLSAEAIGSANAATSEKKPSLLPSKKSGLENVPAVEVPRADGWKMKMSSLLPVSPGTEKLPLTDSTIAPSASSAKPSTFSLDAPSPTSLPSKYIVQVPAVVLPNDVGENAKISSSPPDAPDTANDPRSDTSSVPSSRSVSASMSSLFSANSTSLPSKYNSQLPVVVSPSSVAVNRQISESSTVPEIPGTAPAAAKVNKISVALMT